LNGKKNSRIELGVLFEYFTALIGFVDKGKYLKGMRIII